MPSDFELAELEKVAAVIYITGAIVTIISANKTQQIQIQKQLIGRDSDEQTVSSPLPTPTQLAIAVSWIYLIGNIVFGHIAYTRLIEIQREIRIGTEKRSALPNIYITFGWLLGIAGSLVRLYGVQLRAAQNQPITIL